MHKRTLTQTPNLGQQLLSLHSNVAAETSLRINAVLCPFRYSKGRRKGKVRFNQIENILASFEHKTLTLGDILGGNHLYAGLLSCPFPPRVFVLGGFAVTLPHLLWK